MRGPNTRGLKLDLKTMAMRAIDQEIIDVERERNNGKLIDWNRKPDPILTIDFLRKPTTTVTKLRSTRNRKRKSYL